MLFDTNGHELHTLTGEWSDISIDIYNPDSSCVIFESQWCNEYRKKAYAWNFEQNELRIFLSEPKTIREKLFIDNDNVIIVLSDNTAILWDVKNNTKSELKGSSWRSYLILSPQQNLMASFSFGKKKIMMLDLEGNEIARLDKDNTRSDFHQFTLDGSKMIALFTDDIMQVWDITTNKRNFLFGHKKTIEDFCVSPDEHYILTSSKDHTMRLWNLQGEQLCFLDGDAKTICELCFSADGKKIMGFKGKDLLIWDISFLADVASQANEQ